MTKSVTIKIPTVVSPAEASRVVRTIHQALLTVLVTFLPLVAYFGVPAATVAEASAALTAVLGIVSKVYQTLFPAAPALAPVQEYDWGTPQVTLTAPDPVVPVAADLLPAPVLPAEDVPAVVQPVSEPVVLPDPAVAVLPGGATETVVPD